MKLWLDDMRPPPDDSWVWAKNVEDAKACLLNLAVDEASLDHDLGACLNCLNGLTAEDWLRRTDFTQMPNCDHFGTGYTLVSWMEETGHWPDKKPTVHSRNPAGAARMRQVIDKHYGPFR